MNSFGLNIYDLLYHDQLVLSRSAANELEQLLGGRSSEETPDAEQADDAPAPKRKRTRKTEQEAA